jgi:hypothetical protein
MVAHSKHAYSFSEPHGEFNSDLWKQLPNDLIISILSVSDFIYTREHKYWARQHLYHRISNKRMWIMIHKEDSWNYKGKDADHTHPAFIKNKEKIEKLPNLFFCFMEMSDAWETVQEGIEDVGRLAPYDHPMNVCLRRNYSYTKICMFLFESLKTKEYCPHHRALCVPRDDSKHWCKRMYHLTPEERREEIESGFIQ